MWRRTTAAPRRPTEIVPVDLRAGEERTDDRGDAFWQLRRRVPVLTVAIDTPDRIREWFAIVDELTDRTGLVTSEMVPAFHATAPTGEHGGLRLAQLWDDIR